MGRRWLRRLAVGIGLVSGVCAVGGSVAVPVSLLLRADDATLSRWSRIGEAVGPIGVFFSGIAFIAISMTLLYQGRELRQQRDELTIALEQQHRSSEIALRALHTDLIKMAIDDRELRQVWPPIAPGVPETKKDHYCNLVLNLQKIAYETHTIERAELRAALDYLFRSHDMYAFWSKARAARVSITGGDATEDFFTQEVDRAYEAARPTAPPAMSARIVHTVRAWWSELRPPH